MRLNPAWPIAALAGTLAFAILPSGQNGASAQPAPAQCSTTEMGNASFGAPVEVGVTLNASQSDVRKLLSSSDVEAKPDAIRFKVSFEDAEDADWMLEFRDEGLRLLDRIEAKDFEDDASIWTGRFNAGQASAHLLGASGTTSIEIEEAITYRQDATGELFSVLEGTPRWQSLHGNEDEPPMGRLNFARTGDSVGMMVASGSNRMGQTESWCCSGVMLTPTIYLTNWHCGGNKGFSQNRYWGSNVNESVLIDLGWDGGARNRQYRSEEVLHTNQNMDFAILRVAPTRGGTGDDIGATGVALGKDPTRGQQGVIIHHPLCQPKKATVQACKIGKVRVKSWTMPNGSALQDADFFHTCDTETGSSGAPVFDATGKLIGLHHLGVGQPQLCEANPPKQNRAVRVEAILEDIKANAPEIHAELVMGINIEPQ